MGEFIKELLGTMVVIAVLCSIVYGIMWIIGLIKIGLGF